MSSDAVRTAGSVFNLSRMLTRSATAAGQAVMGELEALQRTPGTPAPAESEAGSDTTGLEPVPAGDVAVGVAASAGAPTAAQTQPLASAPTAAPVPLSATIPPAGGIVPVPAPDPVPARPLQVDPDQQEILGSATTAIVAVNSEGTAPQLTTAAVLWDGSTIRFATLGWSRRTTMIRADPRVTVLVDSPDGARFVTVIGRALIAEGRSARAAAWPLLLREAGAAGEAGAEARWQELVAADADRAVIVVEAGQVLSGRR
jgi:nitroimidazol reductase NimA-like FMN-containing flavoprotein (pyridoxamine 5'-phosphate oxidase superfamily)